MRVSEEVAMRISAYLTNSEVALAALCGLLLAPALWIIIIALQIAMEAVG